MANNKKANYELARQIGVIDPKNKKPLEDSAVVSIRLSGFQCFFLKHLYKQHFQNDYKTFAGFINGIVYAAYNNLKDSGRYSIDWFEEQYEKWQRK